jgi:hypothetical protein
MRREDYVFCIGFEGSTAIIDGRLMRRHGKLSTNALAEAGLYKQALASAIWSADEKSLAEVLAIYNGKTATPVRSVEELIRIFGLTGVPEGVKKITVV